MIWIVKSISFYVCHFDFWQKIFLQQEPFEWQIAVIEEKRNFRR